VFHGWSFTAAQALEAGPEKGMDIARPSVLVRVCLDTEDTTKESNEANNCMEKPLGMPYVFDFALYATTAEWKSGNDPLKWPMAPTDVHGAAFISNYRLEDGQFYSGALAMYPKHVSNGSIQGLFGEPYSKYAYSGITTKDIEMPPDAKFTAKVGFKEGAKTDGVTVSFGYFEPSLNLVWLKSAKVQYDGKLDDFQVDLSSLVGKKVKFILKVDAGNSWEDDFFTLVGPKITQWL
jgi:hypothetical protein